MYVYFSKLGNGDWICYDAQNTTGDLFVDPSKIQLLQEKLGQACGSSINGKVVQFIEFPMRVTIPHFGQIHVKAELWFRNNCICNLTFLHPFETEAAPICEFHQQFVLELDELPAFDPYPYPEDEPDGSV